jgi:hypothetical protein
MLPRSGAASVIAGLPVIKWFENPVLFPFAST